MRTAAAWRCTHNYSVAMAEAGGRTSALSRRRLRVRVPSLPPISPDNRHMRDNDSRKSSCKKRSEFYKLTNPAIPGTPQFGEFIRSCTHSKETAGPCQTVCGAFL